MSERDSSKVGGWNYDPYDIAINDAHQRVLEN